MVSNFAYVSPTLNKKRTLNLGVNVARFNEIPLEEGGYREDFAPPETLEWIYNGRKVQYFNEEEKIIDAYPSADLEKVVVVFDTDPYDNPRNDNAIILNGDGSFYMRLVTPELVSKFTKDDDGNIIKPTNPTFSEVHWGNFQERRVTIISILFLEYWYEERVLDPNTGEIGDFVRDGRL